MKPLKGTVQEGVIDTHVLVGASLPAASSQCDLSSTPTLLFLILDPAHTVPTNPVYGNPCKAVNLSVHSEFDAMYP